MKNKKAFVMLHVMVVLALSHILYWGLLKINYYITEKNLLWQNFYQTQIQESLLQSEITKIYDEIHQSIEGEIKQNLLTFNPIINGQIIEGDSQYGVMMRQDENEIIIYHHQLFIPEIHLENFREKSQLQIDGIMLSNNLTQVFTQDPQENRLKIQTYLDYFLENGYRIHDEKQQEAMYFFRNYPLINRDIIFDGGSVAMEKTKDSIHLFYEMKSGFNRQDQIALPEFRYTIESSTYYLEKEDH